MIALQLKRGSSPLRVSLPLPATPAAVEEAYSRLDSISTAAVTKIAAVTGDIPNLSNYLAGKEIDGDNMLSKLNALGERIESMTVSGRQMFAGALDSESINGLDDVLRIAGSLGAYTIMASMHTMRNITSLCSAIPVRIRMTGTRFGISRLLRSVMPPYRSTAAVTKLHTKYSEVTLVEVIVGCPHFEGISHLPKSVLRKHSGK